MITLDDMIFDAVIDADDPILVCFYDENIRGSESVLRAANDLSFEYEEVMCFGKLDVGKYKQIAASYNIEIVPSLVLYQSGRILDVIAGAAPKYKIQEKLETLLCEEPDDRFIRY